MNSTGDAATGAGISSGQGVIDVEGGYTQEEQLAELEAVVSVMREHFGEDVATIDGEPWTVERHDAEVAPRPEGSERYRHKINFDVPDRDLEQMYATAEEIAGQLGLSENLNNSNGVTQYDKIFYGAGREQERTFVIASTTTGDGYRASYGTRRSDDSSLDEAFQAVVERNSEESDKGRPWDTRDREDVPGYEPPEDE